VRRLAHRRMAISGYDPWKLMRWVRRTGARRRCRAATRSGTSTGCEPNARTFFRAADRFLEPVDWLGLKLSGRVATTGPTATLHWVTDTRDAAGVRYDDDLLRCAGLRREQPVPLLDANAVLGPLTAEAREARGLPRAVPVVAGTPETMASCRRVSRLGRGPEGSHTTQGVRHAHAL